MNKISPENLFEYKCYDLALKENNKDPYKDSAFKIFKQMSSKKKGKYFELIVEEYLRKNNYRVQKAVSTDHDRIVKCNDNTIKALEIKGSFLWGDGTHFRWQQIRTNQDYDVICFLAVFPDRIELYGSEKNVVRDNLEIQNDKGEWMYNQHGGKSVNSGTFFMDGMPEDFKWFKPLVEVL